MAQPALASMPIELLVHIIATYLSTEDLGALRLTSKYLEQALFDSFAREFFTKKQFMLTTPSLTTLIDIAKHPALSKSLQHVIIGLDHYQYTSNGFTTFGEAEKYYQGFADQQYLIHSGQDREMLAEALCALPNLKTIGIRDYSAVGRVREGSRWNSYGAPTVFRETGLMLPPHKTGADILAALPAKMFTLIMNALADAKKPVPEIETILRAIGSGLSDAAFYLPEYQSVKFEPVLQGLKTLLLTVNPGMAHPVLHIDNSDDVMGHRYLKQFLTRLPNLTHLRLNYQSHDRCAGKPMVEWLGDSKIFPLPKLERLDIGMTAAPPELLLRVIALHAQTLRHINLWKFGLTYPRQDITHDVDDRPHPWRSFLETLAGVPNLNLTNIMLGNTYHYDGVNPPINVQFITEAAKAVGEDTEKRLTYGHKAFDQTREYHGKMSDFLPKLIEDAFARWPVGYSHRAQRFDQNEDEDMDSDDDEDEDFED
ncbi:hypothetical protein BU24DRAFT_405915 [Aaosphaeria arxii CBS 175.79]|uniref:F-box domain-containing protein n=1 Tax=Aaosphaeria arxii CBS 175.79 TaxID=1450172 RepID=A0A6A5Y160_9PLEO|nr:uncharacterized protein BU24DRAFT_405915 [Aaosphaeria arxii CBS 175.79]KAF2019212.1 hypothetical protein BU24DRAFT_405915 [Aaosphaeria arxii CBS 175.79]